MSVVGQYRSKEARGAAAGLVAQSKALLLNSWCGYDNSLGNSSAPGGSYAGSGRYVYENFDADTAEGYGYSSEAQPMYSLGALAGFVGLRDAFGLNVLCEGRGAASTRNV